MASQGFVDSSHCLPVPAPPWADLNFNGWRPGRSMEAHAHPWLQVIHVLEGLLEVDFGGGWVAVRGGHAHVLPPGRTHRLRTVGGHRQFGLNFAPADRARDERGLHAAMLASFREPVVVRAAFAPAWGALLAASPAAMGPLALAQRCHALEAYCLGLLEAAAPASTDEPGARLLALLADRAQRPLRVAEVARALGLSRTSAQRLCQRSHGCGIAHLHQRLRLARAATLLGGDRSIARIAADCGYPDVYAFGRAFRREHGRPPGAYRRALRAGMG